MLSKTHKSQKFNFQSVYFCRNFTTFSACSMKFKNNEEDCIVLKRENGFSEMCFMFSIAKKRVLFHMPQTMDQHQEHWERNHSWDDIVFGKRETELDLINYTSRLGGAFLCACKIFDKHEEIFEVVEHRGYKWK